MRDELEEELEEGEFPKHGLADDGDDADWDDGELDDESEDPVPGGEAEEEDADEFI